MDTDTRNRFVTLISMIAQNWKYYVLLNRFFFNQKRGKAKIYVYTLFCAFSSLNPKPLQSTFSPSSFTLLNLSD